MNQPLIKRWRWHLRRTNDVKRWQKSPKAMQCWNHWKITAGHHIKSIYNASHGKDYWIKWVSERVEPKGERESERANERVHSSNVSMTMTLSNKWFFACVNCFDSKHNAKLLLAHHCIQWATVAFRDGFQRLSFNVNESTQLDININLGSYISAECVKWNGFSAFVNRKLIWVKVIRFAILLRKSIWSAGFFRW